MGAVAAIHPFKGRKLLRHIVVNGRIFIDQQTLKQGLTCRDIAPALNLRQGRKFVFPHTVIEGEQIL